MLDSGASCNFISLNLLRTLGLDVSKFEKYSVRLANGGVLSTCGTVDLHVKFGSFHYFGTFYVLQCDVPLILGMQFFRKIRPEIDWKSGSVFVRNRGKYVCLPSVGLQNGQQQVVQKSSTSATLLSENQFGDLDVDKCVDDCVHDTLSSSECDDAVGVTLADEKQ